MESQPQNPQFRNNPENFHPWALSSNDKSGKPVKMHRLTTAFCCWHTQSIGIDKDTNQN